MIVFVVVTFTGRNTLARSRRLRIRSGRRLGRIVMVVVVMVVVVVVVVTVTMVDVDELTMLGTPHVIDEQIVTDCQDVGAQSQPGDENQKTASTVGGCLDGHLANS